MNGNRYFLDTNAVIRLLRNEFALNSNAEKIGWMGMSIISKIEFLSFQNLSQDDIDLFNRFMTLVNVVNITLDHTDIVNQTIFLRKQYKLKLPDAIIAASALTEKATLITADNDFKVIRQLNIQLI